MVDDGLQTEDDTGRGIPKIIQAYSENNIQFNENSINMINCFCMFSDYKPLTLSEWIEVDQKRRKEMMVEGL